MKRILFLALLLVLSCQNKILIPQSSTLTENFDPIHEKIVFYRAFQKLEKLLPKLKVERFYVNSFNQYVAVKLYKIRLRIVRRQNRFKNITDSMPLNRSDYMTWNKSAMARFVCDPRTVKPRLFMFTPLMNAHYLGFDFRGIVSRMLPFKGEIQVVQQPPPSCFADIKELMQLWYYELAAREIDCERWGDEWVTLDFNNMVKCYPKAKDEYQDRVFMGPFPEDYWDKWYPAAPEPELIKEEDQEEEIIIPDEVNFVVVDEGSKLPDIVPYSSGP